MAWSIERKLEWYLRQPWTVDLAREEDGSWFVRVQELPAALADGETPEELEQSYWESLRETLRAYLLAGDTVPLPASREALAPWDQPPAKARPRIIFSQSLKPSEEVETESHVNLQTPAFA